MFSGIDENEYCKPILVKTFNKDGYKEYESKGNITKSLSLEEYIQKITPYLKELIDIHKNDSNNFKKWKIQINGRIKNVSIENSSDVRTSYVWSKNKEIRSEYDTNDIIENTLESFFNNYQKEEEISREKSNLVFDSVDLLQYKFHKTSLKRGSSYIKSPEWLLNKKAVINPKVVGDNCCFQYAVTVALNHMNISNHPESVEKHNTIY